MTANKSMLPRQIHIEHPYEDSEIVVHFVGDDIFSNQKYLELHRNPGFEICLIPYGKGFFSIEHQTFPIGVNQIFMTKAPQLHAGWPAPECPYRILYICFQVKDSASAPGGLWNTLGQKLEEVDFPVVYDRFDMAPVHHRLLEEIQDGGPYSRQMLGTLIQQFVLLTLRNFALGGGKDGSAGFQENDMHISSRVMKLIDKYVFENLSLDTISSELNYSVPYLCRCFKEETGFTIMEYHTFSRLEKARFQLLQNCESVSQLAEKFGYSSIHHFSNSFKALYGCSPIQYRKNFESASISR